jgi:hypothetical protein
MQRDDLLVMNRCQFLRMVFPANNTHKLLG